MNYKNGKYKIESIYIRNLSDKLGTPAYIYSYNKIKNNIKKFKNNFQKINPLICFSVKSNSNLDIIKIMKKFGIGADVVSLGELILAIKAGINPKKIVFSGVGKKSDEIKYAIEKGILLINAESENEVIEIEKIAKKKNKKVKIGIRLNPNTDAKTLKNISTGKKENKFGIGLKDFLKIVNKFKNSRYLNISCLSVHIGSQITSNKPYDKMIKIIQNTIDRCGYKFEYVDLGGGMGIKYNNEKEINYNKYEKSIMNFLKSNDSKIIFEPGRSLIGNAGVLLTKVIYIKDGGIKRFIILDAGMNDLIRPALYKSNHKIMTAVKSKNFINKKHEFVGPICETTDSFGIFPKFQKLKQGDILIIGDVGAYGKVLSSNYNLRPSSPEILIKGSKYKIIKKRQKISELI